LGQDCRATGVRKACGLAPDDRHTFARMAPSTVTVSHPVHPRW
jgi:hypothetical protein